MKIEVSKPGHGVYVLRVQGEVDMSTSPDLRQKLVPLFGKGVSHVIVDLSGTPYMDSSGIATLVEGLQLGRKWNIRFTLAAVAPSVQAIFDLAHLKSVFEMVPGLDHLLQGKDRS